MPARRRAARWFDARGYYADGFPGQTTTALRLFPKICEQLRRYVTWIGPELAVEVGPGDRPLIEGVPRAVYMELSAHFLRGLRGMRVIGDVRRPPLLEQAFELAVAADVFTHVPPDDRPLALAGLMRLAPRLLLFNNAHGSPDIDRSATETASLVDPLRAAGWHVEQHDYASDSPDGHPMRMAILYAVRARATPRVVAAG